MATHSSVLAWRIPGTGEPGGLHRVRHYPSDLAAAAAALMTTELTGSYNSLLLPSILREYPTTYHYPENSTKFQSMISIDCISFHTSVKLKNHK